MPNPFVYGEIVPEAAFADRVDELAELVADLENAQKVFLISPRRYGKSSLIRRALASLQRHGHLTVEVTVASYSSYLAFLEGYARAIASIQTPWDRARAWLREALGANRPEIRVEPDVGGGRLDAEGLGNADGLHDAGDIRPGNNRLRLHDIAYFDHDVPFQGQPPGFSYDCPGCDFQPGSVCSCH